MTAKDNVSQIKVVHAIAPVAIAADGTTASETIDTAGFSTLTFVPYCGAYTDGTFTPVMKHSADDGMSGEVVVPDADLLPAGTGQEATAAIAAANGISKIGYVGGLRYVTCDILASAVTSGVAGFAVIAILSDPSDAPVA